MKFLNEKEDKEITLYNCLKHLWTNYISSILFLITKDILTIYILIKLNYKII